MDRAMLKINRRWWWAPVLLIPLAGLVYFALPYFLQTGEHEPPLNTVVISERLASSGQPSAAQLRRLGAQGYAAVINLAPPTSYGSVSDEAELVRAQGLTYHNIPVVWDRPTAADLAQFRTVLEGLRGQRVWVHCQMNMRASVFVLLHRVIDERVPLAEALTAVHTVWLPNEVWAGFIRDILTQHGVAFDPDDLR
jgi:protein tyrosine phosphatase (PTP) superfamily phosphohydrolase (DUF442 family)